MNKTLTQEQRISIVCYRIESAENTLAEVETHRANGFYNTAVNRLYYACYYAATAILIANGIEVKSHDGVRMNLWKVYCSRRYPNSRTWQIFQSSVFKAFHR